MELFLRKVGVQDVRRTYTKLISVLEVGNWLLR